MLPMTLQFLIVMIASAIDDRLQRKLDYVEEERRILKEQIDALTGGKRLSFTAHQRRRLAEAGKLLSPDERRKCCQLVKPATMLAWFRRLAAKKYDNSKTKRGRPPKPKDVRKLVVEMALANPGWGYTKIRDALRTGLAVEIGRTTVANILPEAGIEPAPKREKKRTWKEFVKAHWESLSACDFFRVEVLGLGGTVRYLVLSDISHIGLTLVRQHEDGPCSAYRLASDSVSRAPLRRSDVAVDGCGSAIPRRGESHGIDS